MGYGKVTNKVSEQLQECEDIISKCEEVTDWIDNNQTAEHAGGNYIPAGKY